MNCASVIKEQPGGKMDIHEVSLGNVLDGSTEHIHLSSKEQGSEDDTLAKAWLVDVECKILGLSRKKQLLLMQEMITTLSPGVREKCVSYLLRKQEKLMKINKEKMDGMELRILQAISSPNY